MFRTRDLAAWEDFFGPLDIPFSPVLGAGELFEDAHVRARGVVRRVPTEAGIAVNFPVRFSLGLPEGDDFVAKVGEHSIASGSAN
ncbi:hypothetical protein D3C81_1917080 [compost metagenome]